MNKPADSYIMVEATSMKASRFERLFLICDRCYWSASALPTRKSDTTRCPNCDNEVSDLPLSADEHYSFIRDEKRGVEVSFS